MISDRVFGRFRWTALPFSESHWRKWWFTPTIRKTEYVAFRDVSRSQLESLLLTTFNISTLDLPSLRLSKIVEAFLKVQWDSLNAHTYYSRDLWGVLTCSVNLSGSSPARQNSQKTSKSLLWNGDCQNWTSPKFEVSLRRLRDFSQHWNTPIGNGGELLTSLHKL